MKIVRSDSERLIVDGSPLALFIVACVLTLAGVFFLVRLLAGPLQFPGDAVELMSASTATLGGGLLLLMTPRRAVLNFDLMHRELRWEHRSLFLRKGGVIPFNRILNAQVEVKTVKGEDGPSLSSRLVIHTISGEIPINPLAFSGQGSDPHKICEAINRALHGMR